MPIDFESVIGQSGEEEEVATITDEQFTALMNVAAHARRITEGEEHDLSGLIGAVNELYQTGITEDDLDFWLDDTLLPVKET